MSSTHDNPKGDGSGHTHEQARAHGHGHGHSHEHAHDHAEDGSHLSEMDLRVRALESLLALWGDFCDAVAERLNDGDDLSTALTTTWTSEATAA